MERVALLRELKPLLQTQSFGRTSYGYQKIDSTNTEAMNLARRGAPEGTLVYAEHQTAGRGRYGRRWEDIPGQNLLFSLILRPSLPPYQWSLLPLMASLAIAETLDYVISPLETRIKWPNDVLIHNRKVSGILMEAELSSSSNASPFLVLGIGLNVNQVDFPGSIAHRATSLMLETGRFIPRAPLLARLLRALEDAYRAMHSPVSRRRIHTLYGVKMAHLGKEIQLFHQTKAQILSGIIAGITPEGALRLMIDGQEHVFHSGEITYHDQESQ